MSLVPGKKKINVHACYAIFEKGEFADRDALEPKHFKKWVEFAKAHGMGIDFDIGIQYRGIRQFGIGLYFSYHLVFTDTDYMTAGITLQWYSGMF